MEENKRIFCVVDLDAIRFNLEEMHKRAGENAKITAVVKTDAYGHGACAIAHEIEGLNYLWGFAVATDEEAFLLRESGVEKPILILGYTFPESYKEIVAKEIRPVVFKEDMAQKLSEEAKKQGKKVYFHLGVDIGMGRIGVSPDESSLSLVKKMASLPNVVMEGIFTHFPKADTEDLTDTKKQLKLFSDYISLLKENGVDFPLHHIANSAGIAGHFGTDLELVRAGIILYGMWPSDETERTFRLKPALALKTHIVYIKEAAPGTEISYGGTWKAERTSRIATLPAGYGDGYPRGLSGKGYVLIHGKRAPICGRVCMDQVMVDVTDIPEAEEYDEVTLVGRDGEEEITLEEIAGLSGTFHYEIPCCINKRVPRIYMKNGRKAGEMNYFSEIKSEGL